ncbi:MAG: glycosyltransferase family 4 protein [Magnetococcales bacterium]|nr:glycosyltransferase family 4 protein [Magnetococcales bacterium]
MSLFVTINGRFLAQPITGVQRFALETVKALDQLLLEDADLASRVRFQIAAPPRIGLDPCLHAIPLKQGGLAHRLVWEQFSLPRMARGGGLLNLANIGPLLFSGPQWIVMHDAAVFRHAEAYTWWYRLLYQGLQPLLGKRARAVMVPSSFSAHEIHHFMGIDPDAIRLLPGEGHQHLDAVQEEPNTLERHDLTNKPFFLTVASLSRHKNLQGLIRALGQLPDLEFTMVLVGKRIPGVFEHCHLPEDRRVRQLGFVSDGELKALYSHARGLIQPSFYEGFGLPPLEAMACGCPLLVSNAGSLPELCDEAALYFDPAYPEEIARAMRRLLEEPGLAGQLAEAGRKRAQRFSWKGTARKLSGIILEPDPG